MNCREARSALHRAADGALSIEERLALEAHVRDCERCAPLARRFAELEAAFARLPEPPVESLDVEAQVRAVRARLGRVEPARAPAGKRVLVLAAAAVLVAALAGLALLLRTSRPEVAPIVEDGGRAPREVEDAAPAPTNTTVGERVPAEFETRVPETHDATPDAPIVPPSSHDDVATLAPAPEAAPAPLGATAPTDEDLARADAARARLASALVAAAAAAPADRAGLALAFDRATASLVREQWPIARMAEGVALGPDTVSARAAVRFLGVRGDRGALATLQRALEREELAQDAALALADLGEPALDAIFRTVEVPRFEAPVLARLAARGSGAGEDAVHGNTAGDANGVRGDAAGTRLLEAIVRRARRAETNGPASNAEAAARLGSHAAFALARSGGEALDALLRLASDGALAGSEVWNLVRLVPDAGTRLAALVRTNARMLEGRGLAPSSVLRAVDALHPEGGVAWLDALAREDRARRDDALAALAGYDDAESADVLLRWHASGRVGTEFTRGLFESLVVRRPTAAAELARKLAVGRDRAQVHELFALLTAHTVPAHVPALAELAATPLLARGDRRTAIQLVAELDFEDSQALLEALWPRIEDDERELRAACVMALHRVGGRDALARLFARAPQRTRDRLIAVCDTPDALARPTTTLFRVLQELDAVGSRGAP